MNIHMLSLYPRTAGDHFSENIYLGCRYGTFLNGETCEFSPNYILGWLIWANGPLRQYFSLYRAVSQREGVRKNTPTRTYCKHSRPCPTIIQIVGRPGTGSLPRTIAPPDHPPSPPPNYNQIDMSPERFISLPFWYPTLNLIYKKNEEYTQNC